MSTLSFRIQHARLTAGLSRTDVARTLNVSTETVRAWELPESDPHASVPSLRRLPSIAELFNTTPEYLLTGTDARLNADKYAFIQRYKPTHKERKLPHYDPVKNLNNPDESYAYRIDMLERLGITAGHCRVVEIIDTSMDIGDQQLVDLKQTKIIAGKVYVFESKKNGLMARYFYPCDGDMLAMRSDKNNTPEIVERNDINIVGRVVHCSGAM